MKNLLLIAGIALLSSCGEKTATESSAKNTTQENENLLRLTDAQLKSTDLKLVQLTNISIASIVKMNGKIDVPPQNMISISMPLGGYLKSTKLLPGMHIKKGEVIAIMEDQQYIQLQQEYLTTAAKLKFASAELNRQKNLNNTQSSSDKVLQQAEMEYSTYKVALSALSEQLKLINIAPHNLSEVNLSKSVRLLSPINGFVSRVNINIGKYVNPADVLFELVDPSDIHLNLTVFEKDLNELSVGQKIWAHTNHNPEKKYPGEIILISKNLTNEGATEVHCHFEKYDKTLVPGMYMNAEIDLKNHQTKAVPEIAVVGFEGGKYVFIAKNSHEFELQKVITGNKENGFIEIKNASVLKGKTIVAEGAYTLLMQLRKE